MNSSLVLSSLKPISGFDVQDDGTYSIIYGDSLSLELPDGDDGINVSVDIIDILSIDEESDSETFLPGHPDLTNFLVVNMDLLQAHLDDIRVDQVYIKVSGNGDAYQIISDIQNELGDAVLHIESALIQIDNILSTRSSQSVFGIYSLNVIFSLLYLTLGMTIVTYEKNRKLSKHYSVLRALGTERKNVGIAIISDVFLSIAIACTIGALVAFVMSLLVIQTPMIYFGANNAIDWYQLPVSLVIPIEGLLAFILASFLIPGFISAIVIRRQLGINLADDLSSSE
ncbi:MAG: ABC transporter permease [Candidatus Thorarchaeota archaeon]|nr:ABC transporter permease [Candidatus Thorarchaeota archaeon]